MTNQLFNPTNDDIKFERLMTKIEEMCDLERPLFIEMRSKELIKLEKSFCLKNPYRYIHSKNGEKRLVSKYYHTYLMTDDEYDTEEEYIPEDWKNERNSILQRLSQTPQEY
jgi:hypothetical protein